MIEVQKVLDDVLNRVCDKMGFTIATISLIDEDQQEITTRRGKNVPETWIKDAHHSQESEDVQAYVLRTGNTVHLDGEEAFINGAPARKDGKTFRLNGQVFTLDWAMFEDYGHKDLDRVFVPLGQVGTIEAGFWKWEHKKIDSILIKELERYAVKATVTIQNALAHEQVQQHAAMLNDLQEESYHLQTVSQGDDEPSLRQQIADTALRLFDADIAMLYLRERTNSIDQAEPCFIRPSTALAPNKKLKLGWEIKLPNRPGNIVQEIAKNRQSYFSTDAQDDPLLVGNDPHVRHNTFTVHQEIRSFAGVPLEFQDELLGVLCINYRKRHQFSEHAKQVFELFAQQAALVIESNQLMREQERLGRKNESLRKKMEQKNVQLERSYKNLHRQKEYFEGLVLHSPVAIAAQDLADNVVSWNRAAEKLFGYKEEEAVGRSIEDLIIKTPKMQEEAASIRRELLRGSQVHHVTQRSRKDGTLVDVDLVVVPAIEDGERVGTFAMYHDIRELQRARQQAEAANEAKTEFVKTVSHELRQPLTVIMSGIYVLRKKAVIAQSPQPHGTAEVLSWNDLINRLQEIYRAGEDMQALLGNVLDLSEIEEGEMRLSLTTFDVARMVEDTVRGFRSQADHKGIVFDVKYVPDPIGEMYADQIRVAQVLRNLLTNAFKFTSEGFITVTVAREEDWITFTVRDTGIGMTEEYMKEKLFQKFSRPARDGDGTGAGLGLIISRNLCHMMGGEITSESDGENKGSTFTIRLPIRVQNPTGER